MHRTLLALLPLLAAALRAPAPSSVAPQRRAPATRRSVLFTMPLAAAATVAAMPSLRANAACSCPKGLASCVCTDDDDTVGKRSSINQKRADAAGRDAIQSKKEISEMRQAYDEAPIIVRTKEPTLGRSKTSASARAVVNGERPKTESVQADFVGLSGGGSLNYGEIDKNQARERFLKILAETVDKREREYGFELDANDIKQIESVLRIKYCGPQGKPLLRPRCARPCSSRAFPKRGLAFPDAIRLTRKVLHTFFFSLPLDAGLIGPC